MVSRAGVEPAAPGLKGRCSTTAELTAQYKYIQNTFFRQINLIMTKDAKPYGFLLYFISFSISSAIDLLARSSILGFFS